MSLPGSYYADFMVQIFGGGAYVFSFVLLSWGYQLVKYHTVAFYRAVACFVAMICASSTLALRYSESIALLRGGGICGEYFRSFAQHMHISSFALFWILGSLFLIAIVIAIRLDFSAFVGFCGRAYEYLNEKLQLNEICKISLINFKTDSEEEGEGYRKPEIAISILEEHDSSNLSSFGSSDRRESGKFTAKSQNSSKQQRLKEKGGNKDYDKEYDFVFPSINLLKEPPKHDDKIAESELKVRADTLVHVLNEFGIDGEITDVGSGPVVTLYELKPAPGIKSARVIGLASDIARNMSAVSARIAVIPGKNALGIELPNVKRQIVFLREILESSAYKKSSAALSIALGKDIGGGL